MKLKSLLVLLPLVIVACNRSAEGELPSPTMISDELLTITDMPNSWDETQRQVFDVRGNENPSIDPSIWCPEAYEVTKNLVDLAGESGADVEMNASMPDNRARMMRLQAWANDDVKAYYRDAKEAVRICDGVTTTDDSGVKTTSTLIDGRDIGDESISWLQIQTPPMAPGEGKPNSISRTTIARFGSIIMVLQMGDASYDEEAVAMDEDDWWSIVEDASKKLDSLDSRVHK